MMAYLVRHYIFTVTVLRSGNKNKVLSNIERSTFEPAVTILIPAHNEEKVIGRLLQRIVELTYPKDKLQVVVINDASTDQTGAIAEDYGKIYPFMEVLNRDKSNGGKGKSSAMNDGFRKSTGDIVLCFDLTITLKKILSRNLSDHLSSQRLVLYREGLLY